MPTYLTPGVYVEEVPSTSKPIEGVSTSVAAFVGLAPAGPVNTPMRISNWSQFANLYGDAQNDQSPFMAGSYLAHCVYGFFQNGGNLCWIVRVGKPEAAGAPSPQVALPAAADDKVETMRILARPGVEGQVKVDVVENPVLKPEQDGDGEGEGDGKPTNREPTYKITVTAPGASAEEYDGLTVKKGRSHIATKVNAASKLIKIEETGGSLPDGQRTPAAGTYMLSAPSVPTDDIDASDYAGEVARRRGIGGLAAVDEITMISIPDIWAIAGEGKNRANIVKDLQGKLISHCENAGDRMAILDAPPSMRPEEVLDWRNNEAGYDSKFATLYWPWVEVLDPTCKQPIMIPPSGHVAGVWCRSDATVGVHKAPANEVAMGVLSPAFQITQAEQGSLNKAGINCIRSFSGRGIRIWGARTLSSDPEWRYINVRRLFNYISESIMEGTQWSVFEPNDRKLWGQLKFSATSFLTRTWREGALFGSSPDQAFFVKCDDETNPPDVIEAGQVVCEIGIAPVKPAEFVIFRLSQYADGGGTVET